MTRHPQFGSQGSNAYESCLLGLSFDMKSFKNYEGIDSTRGLYDIVTV